jgi:iron complex outermembrane recepter protein
MNRIPLLILLAALSFNSHAQTETDTTAIPMKTFQLGEVIVTETIDKEIVRANEMHKFNACDVGTSISGLPSIVINSIGARNESTVFLRGFDIRSVPVFMDGIPVYVPYDGYVDLARFTTYDISKIDVSKGFSSMMYGANTIGGVINLVGMKPSHKLEISAKVGAMSGNGNDAILNLGSNLGKVYIQTGLSLLNREFVPLSADFDTSGLETNHKRDNSSRKDLKGSIKVGYTPNSTNEYSINYIISHGSKGNPIYLGADNTVKIRYWDWPYWDKQSIYFISKTAIGLKSYLKARLYYDEFKNKLSSYDDNTYITQERGYAFNSFYDDYTLGGNLEFSSDLSNSNTFKLSAHMKNDNHSEHNEGEPVRHFADNTFSFSLENIYRPVGKLTLIPGIGYNLRKSLKAEDYNSKDQTISELPENTNDAFNAQLASYFKFSGSFSANFNIAYKSRFATMKDRYSYRSGTAIPNPDLKSESALNFELAAYLTIAEKLKLRPELFYSRLYNTIQTVDNVQDDLSQMQNTGSSEFAGADFNLVYQPFKSILLSAVYSYIHRENLSNPEILFTDVPGNKVIASAEYNYSEKLFVNVSGEFNSERNNASDGSRVSPAFAIANAEFSYRFAKYITAEFGANNLFDKNYTIQEGYPEMGRNFYIALHFNFQR